MTRKCGDEKKAVEEGRGRRRESGERGREEESHAFEFCQLDSSVNVTYCRL